MNPDPQQSGPARGRLLFVDDEALVLQGLRRSLHAMRAQWDMTFVDSADRALEALAKAPFDAVITDMRMPGKDGAELLEEVKQRYPDAIRIVLSGQANRETVLRAIGPTHLYLAKPCDPAELQSRLAQAFLMRDRVHNAAVRARVSGLNSIPSMPASYREVVAELQSENRSLERITPIVSKDAGMTARILQLANSALMGVHPEISSPTGAITLIGTEMLRALAFSSRLFSQFDDTQGVASYWMALWEHSLTVACLARRIAAGERKAHVMVEESFAAGLLHEIGKLVLLAVMPKDYAAILTQNAMPLAAAERERLGCTHGELGAYLMSIWGLPRGLIHAVAYHDCPSGSDDNQFSALTAVHAADAIASSGASPALQDVELDRQYLNELGLSDREAVWRGFHEQSVRQLQAGAAEGGA